MALADDLGPTDARRSRSRKAQQRGQGAAKHKKPHVLQIHQKDTPKHDSFRGVADMVKDGKRVVNFDHLYLFYSCLLTNQNHKLNRLDPNPKIACG